jgi:elongation factor 3
MVAVLLTLLPTDLVIPSATGLNGPPSARHPLLDQSLQFQGSMVADLVYNRRFRDTEVWKRCVGVYMTSWLGAEGSATFTESARAHFHAVDQVCALLLTKILIVKLHPGEI